MKKSRINAGYVLCPIFAALLAFIGNTANAQATTSFTYDALGRLNQTASPTNTTAYSYDSAGNRTFVNSANTSSYNQSPSAVNDTATATIGSSITINVLGNDYDPDGDALTVTSASGATKGTTSITSGGAAVLYTPNTGQSGPDIFIYTISDGRGGTASATATVAWSNSEIDTIPDAVNWANLSVSTAGNAALTGASFQQITGINQPITLRAQVSGLSGDLSSIQQNIYYNPPGAAGSAGGPWNHAEITENSEFYDFIIEPGQWIYFDAHAVTTSGSRSGSWSTTVTNLTTGAVIDTFTASLAVDTDNNFNVIDATPDAVNWSDLSRSAADNTVLTGASFQQITGISQPITLRVQISGLSGNLSSIQQNIYYNPAGAAGSAGGPWNHAEITGNNGFYDIVIEPGHWIYFDAHAATTSGSRSGSWTTTVTNLTTGDVVDTFTVSVAAGTANPNAVDWSNLSGSTANATAITAASFQQITGISQPINLRVQISGLSGDLSSIQQNVHYNSPGAGSAGGPWSHATITGNNGVFDFAIEPGQWIYFDAYAATVAGARSGGWTTTVTNLTTGAVIDTFTVSLAVGQ